MADLTGIGTAVTGVKDILGMFFPNKTEEERTQIANAFSIIQGQLDANKTEAASTSWFVAGWRPFVGWVCGFGCAWNWIGLPVATFIMAIIGHPMSLRPADISEMMPLLIGMLGLGAYRTAEKIQGAEGNR